MYTLLNIPQNSFNILNPRSNANPNLSHHYRCSPRSSPLSPPPNPTILLTTPPYSTALMSPTPTHYVSPPHLKNACRKFLPHLPHVHTKEKPINHYPDASLPRLPPPPQTIRHICPTYCTYNLPQKQRQLRTPPQETKLVKHQCRKGIRARTTTFWIYSKKLCADFCRMKALWY